MDKFKCCSIQPPAIDFKFLRYLVESAEELRERKMADREDVCAAQGGTAENLREWNNEEEANLIIVQIHRRANFEAKQGNNCAVIMDVPDIDVGYKYYDPGWLTGAAKRVYDYCEKSGLQPTLEHWQYWPDRDGPAKSGFHLVVHW